MADSMESPRPSKLTRDILWGMKLSSRALRRALIGRLYHPPQNATHFRLAVLYARALRSLLDYESCTTEELQTFCRQRGLYITVTQPSRARLINVLDHADEDRTFHGFQILPAELREYIYEFYIEEHPKRKVGERLVSPLSHVSCLVRLESLPIFYKTCVFTINIVDSQRPQRDGVSNVTPKKCLDAKAEEWLSMTASHYLNMVRRLRVSGIVWRSCEVDPPDPWSMKDYHVTWNIHLDASLGNRVTRDREKRHTTTPPPGYKTVASRLSDAVDAMVQSRIDGNCMRKLVEAFEI